MIKYLTHYKMTTVEKIKVISERIRKDILRTMELREGCIIESSGEMFKVIHIFENYPERICLINLENKAIYSGKFTYPVDRLGSFVTHPYKVIGHEIMINDVLEWLNYIIYEKCIPINDLGYSGMVKQFYVKGDDGSIIFEILDLKNQSSGLDIIRYGVWNLSSPYLKDQSDEFIDFLYQIFNK